MKVRPKKAASRKGETPKPVAVPIEMPPPLAGLVLNEALSDPKPMGARILDNWICGLTTVKPRKGFTKFATIATDAVQTMFTYKSGAAGKLFAASDDSIFDISSPASPDVIPTADVTGQANGYYSTEQFGTPGGDYLYALNGVDSPQLYDGSTWTAITGVSSPAIAGVTTSGLSHIWSYANRLFFVESGTMKAWYLPVDSIAGAASSFSLAGVFKNGGSLLFGSTWSMDSGDGPSERCVFFSTEGEVAIYQGTNPGSAADWAILGVYQVARPLGKLATLKAGGDLMVATEVGLVPLSEAMRRDVAALSLGAVSRSIEPLWQRQSGILTAREWQIVKWPSENLMIVSQPEETSTGGTCLVANLRTGSWSRFTGTDTQSLAVFDGGGYFGTSDGVIYQLQSGGSNAGMPYTSVYLGSFENFGSPGAQKTAVEVRATFRSNMPIEPQCKMNVDYDESTSPAPNAAQFSAVDGWGISTWDSSQWDAVGVGVGADESQWVSLGATGYAHGPEIQLTFGTTFAPDVEYIGSTVMVLGGAVVA